MTDSVEYLHVEPEQGGVRLLDFLYRHWPNAHRVAVKAVLASGRLTINGRSETRPGYRLRLHDVLGLPELPADARSFSSRVAPKIVTPPILFEDDEVLVVDKPAAVPGKADRAGREPGIIGVLAESHPELRLVRKLDRAASGCLLLAKTLPAHRRLTGGGGEVPVQTEFAVLVHGAVRFTEQVVEQSLGPDRRRPGKVKVVPADSKGARQAQTDITCTARFSEYSLLSVWPRTARGMQLAVHLAYLGHPVVADPDHSSSATLKLSQIKRGYKLRRGLQEAALLERPFVHAATLQWPGLDGSQCTVTSPLPEDLQVVVDKLQRFG